MKSKTIILSSSKKFESNSPRAILTFFSDNNVVNGKIRLYNMTNLQKGVKLGVYYNNEVLSSPLIRDRDAYDFKIDKKIDIDKELYCALVDTLNKNDVILSGGNDLGFSFSDEESEEDVDEVETLDDPCTDESCKADCKNCIYKKFFYEHQSNINDTSSNQNIDSAKQLNRSSVELEETKEYMAISNENIEDNSNKEEEFEQNEYQNETEYIDLNDRSKTALKEVEEVTENKDRFCFNSLFDDECFDFEHFQKEQDRLQQEKEEANKEKPNLTSPQINIETQSAKNEENQILNSKFNISLDNSNDMQTKNAPNANTPNKETEKFINAISEQLDEMFLNYPIDKEIMAIIPNSKIVKVDDTIDGNNYVVGVIYEDDKIQYLLYGVPTKYNTPPPQELGENYQFLALNPDDPMSDGYYLIYQDASSGKLVPVKVE